MENTANNQAISQLEAVVSSMNENFVELQLTGSYETVQWPKSLLQKNIQVGEKIMIELKNHPLTNIQKVVEKAKKEPADTTRQRALLESLIN